MRKINCIAIDDEPIALFIIKQFCDRKGGSVIPALGWKKSYEQNRT